MNLDFFNTSNAKVASPAIKNKNSTVRYTPKPLPLNGQPLTAPKSIDFTRANQICQLHTPAAMAMYLAENPNLGLSAPADGLSAKLAGLWGNSEVAEKPLQANPNASLEAMEALMGQAGLERYPTALVVTLSQAGEWHGNKALLGAGGWLGALQGRTCGLKAYTSVLNGLNSTDGGYSVAAENAAQLESAGFFPHGQTAVLMSLGFVPLPVSPIGSKSKPTHLVLLPIAPMGMAWLAKPAYEPAQGYRVRPYGAILHHFTLKYKALLTAMWAVTHKPLDMGCPSAWGAKNA